MNWKGTRSTTAGEEVSGWWVPEWFEVESDNDDGSVLVRYRFEWRGDRMECAAVTFEAENPRTEVRTSDLRAANINGALRHGAGRLNHRIEVQPDGTKVIVESDKTGAEVAAARGVTAGARRRDTDAMRAEVARTYLAHDGRDKTEAVADFLSIPGRRPVSVRTASLWVQRAREAGYLPPAMPGKVTEGPGPRPLPPRPVRRVLRGDHHAAIPIDQMDVWLGRNKHEGNTGDENS